LIFSQESGIDSPELEWRDSIHLARGSVQVPGNVYKTSKKIEGMLRIPRPAGYFRSLLKETQEIRRYAHITRLLMEQRPTSVFWRTVAVFSLLGFVLLSASCSAITEFLQAGPFTDESGQVVTGGKRVPIPPTVDDLGVND